MISPELERRVQELIPTNTLLLANTVLVLMTLLFALYLLALAVSLSGLRNERLHRWAEAILGRNLRASFTTGLILLGGVLPIALGIALAQRGASQTVSHIEDRLRDTATVMTQSVDALLNEHTRAVTALSRSLVQQELRDPDLIAVELGETRDIYDAFLTMLATDTAGNVIAAVPRLAEMGLDGDNMLDVRDREYFTVPRRTGESFISEVFQGRGFGRDPIVAISSPLMSDNGRFLGIVEASLDLATFWEVRRLSLRWPEAETLIIDSAGRVIHSSERGRYPVLSQIVDQPIITAIESVEPGNSFRFTATDGSDKDESYLAAFGVTSNGWRVFVKMRTQLPEEELLSNFRVTALWAVLTAMLGVVLATALHRRIGQPLSHLHELVTKFDSEDVDRLLKSDTRRRGIPAEFKQIFVEFRNLRRRLMVAITRQREALRESERLRVELEDVVSERERVIARRTAELERANQLLEREAKIDALTGLPNRRGIAEFLDRCWRACQRREQMLSVIMIDVDHFKNYNDTYGHSAGDACLQEIATVLERHCRRATDLAGRWGGEEFLVVLCETESEHAQHLAEDIRKTVEREAVNWGPASDSSFKGLTISAGVASMKPTMSMDVIESVVDAADAALYRSKRDGRNRVTVSNATAHVKATRKG